MTVFGTFKKGKLELESPAPYADGTQVEVKIVKVRKRLGKKGEAGAKGKLKSKALSPAAAFLLRHAGGVEGLPSDFSRNHDHYLYGVPKKK